MRTKPPRHQIFSATCAPAAAATMTIAVPAKAPAQPPTAGVPDMSGFADVTTDFAGPGPRNTGTIALFSTPSGTGCGMSLDGGSAQCSGALPGIAGFPIAQSGSTHGDCDLGVARITSGGTALINHHKGPCPARSGLTVLASGQKVSGGGITCGVINAQVSACTAGTHGFVLTTERRSHPTVPPAATATWCMPCRRGSASAARHRLGECRRTR